MGYAAVAGLPATSGLHASIVALVVYALVGPSPVLVVGPDSSIAPIIAAAVVPLAVAGSDRRLALAGLLAALVGLVLVAGGLLRLGMVADLLAKPIRVGFLNGVALVIITSQLPRLLDLSARGDDVVTRVVRLADDLGNGRGDGLAFALATGTIALWLALRRWAASVPALPVAMVATTLTAVAFGFDDDVDVVGRLGRGLPQIGVGSLRWRDVATLAPAAIGIAVVAFADSVVLSRAIAGTRRQTVDENREMVGLGVTNVMVGALGGFPVSASSTRTAAASTAGATSQLASIVAALATGALIGFAPNATEYVPTAVLSAAVIIAASSLVDVRSMAHLWRTSRSELALSVTALGGVALLGVLRGVGLAVALAVALFLARASRPYRAELVRVDERKGYHDVARHPEGLRIPGLVMARFDAPLFFANAASFSAFVQDLVRNAPGEVRRVLVAAEPITGIDTTAADELAALGDQLDALGITLVFAEMKGPVKDQLARYGLGARFAQYPTIGTAVDAYVRESGTPWIDWEDRTQRGPRG
jgi:high affinity sulfate transporter 1